MDAIEALKRIKEICDKDGYTGSEFCEVVGEITEEALASTQPRTLNLHLVAGVNSSGNLSDYPIVVRADTPEKAMVEGRARQSVLALENGVVIAVWELDTTPLQWLCKYDKEPMIEYAIANPRAKIVATPLGRAEIGAYKSGSDSPFRGGGNS